MHGEQRSPPRRRQQADRADSPQPARIPRYPDWRGVRAACARAPMPMRVPLDVWQSDGDVCQRAHDIGPAYAASVGVAGWRGAKGPMLTDVISAATA